MFAQLLIVIAVLFAPAVLAVREYPVPAATYDAKDYTTWNNLKRAGKSRRAEIQVDFTADDGSADFVHMFRVDLVGNAYDRGYAQGYLLAREMAEFMGPKLDKFYMDEVLNIDLSSFPEPLQSVLRVLQLKGAAAAPELFKTAMAWVWEKEKQYVPSYYFDEIKGMAVGVCDSLKTKDCSTDEWEVKIQQLNMLPELIRMACTAYGAWGKATPNQGLIQMRALDFGSGPFANYTVIATHRGNEFGNSYVSVSFPGFVGVVTGVSEHGIGVSEKVWMTYDKRSLQPGSYDGEPDIFVLRDILQNSKNRADAEAYVQSINRTWAIWIGVGDYETQVFDLVGYKQSSVVVYTDETAPSMTGQPYIENIAYVDKHPQPSGDGPTGSLPTSLQDFYGNITLETSKIITKNHQTGDLHIASYDFTAKAMNVAIGRINHEGNYGTNNEWKAYNRPYLKFNLNDLWRGL